MSQYFESHVTLEPVFDERLEQLQRIAKRHSFRVAKLLLKKRLRDTEQRSAKDSFCTGRGREQAELEGRMRALITDLQRAGFQVWREKIEHVLHDVKYV